MFDLPTSIELSGKQFRISEKGDYRMVLDCFSALGDAELLQEAQIAACLVIFYEDVKDIDHINIFPDIKEAIEKMFDFFNCGQQQVGANVPYKIIDWEKDEQLIATAINIVAKKETRAEPYIHWWTWMSYYLGIGENCGPLANILSIRHKIVTGKSLEKWEKEFQRNNPQYFNWNRKTVEQEQFENEIMKKWNSNG